VRSGCERALGRQRIGENRPARRAEKTSGLWIRDAFVFFFSVVTSKAFDVAGRGRAAPRITDTIPAPLKAE